VLGKQSFGRISVSFEGVVKKRKGFEDLIVALSDNWQLGNGTVDCVSISLGIAGNQNN